MSPKDSADSNAADAPAWLFGYGSLIWRPDFPFLEQAPATITGFSRRFWQGSHDHRGTPDAPGRVVTLIREAGALCGGMAFRLDHDVRQRVLADLDYREKNGYERVHLNLQLPDQTVSGITYIATPGNFAYLGPAAVQDLAAQIARSVGPSGHNRDYLFNLAHALRGLGLHDPHVFELEAAVKALESAS